MKILFFVNILREGAGMINREISYAEEMHRLKHQVSILSYFNPTAKVSKGITVNRIYPTRYLDQLYNTLLAWPYAFFKIFLHLMMIRPQVVMVDLPGEAKWAYVFRRLFNYKVIFTYHGVANAKCRFRIYRG